jgi:hypothetical protein
MFISKALAETKKGDWSPVKRSLLLSPLEALRASSDSRGSLYLKTAYRGMSDTAGNKG